MWYIPLEISIPVVSFPAHSLHVCLYVELIDHSPSVLFRANINLKIPTGRRQTSYIHCTKHSKGDELVANKNKSNA